MNRDQFLRALRRFCRDTKLPAPVFVANRGKGGHGTIFVGTAFTVAKSGEIGTGLHRKMLSDLGLPKDAF